MTTVRHLGRDTIYYAFGTFLRRATALLLIPIYTSALSVFEFGGLETLTVLVQTLLILLGFGLSNAVLRFYSECEDEADAFVMVRTSLLMVLGLSIGLFLLFLPLADLLSIHLFREGTFRRFIIMAFWWAIGGTVNEQLFAYYRARQEARIYAILSVGLFFLLTLLNISFVRFFKLGLLGILLGNLIAIWFVSLWMVLKFWRVSRTISQTWASKLLIFGLPFIFSRFGWLLLNSADRYFLAYYRDLSEVGIYGLGYKVGMIVQIIVIIPFQLAWGPFVFSRAGVLDERATRDFSRVFTYLLLTFSAVSLTMFIFSAEIVNLLSTDVFADASQVVPYILVAYLFNGVYYWAASMFHLTKKVSLLGAIVFGMAGLNLLLNYLWIPVWGWVGAAWSTVITIGGTGLIMLLVSQYICPVPLEGGRLIKLAAAVVVVSVIHLWIPYPPRVSGWFARAIVLLIMPLLLLLTGFFKTSEFRFIRKLPSLSKQKLYLVFGKTT